MRMITKYGVFYFMTILHLYPCQKVLKDYPEECFTAKQIDDDTRDFKNYNVPTSKADDLKLKKGWYRIMGPKTNSLKQGFDKAIAGDSSSPPNFCGTVYAGALMGNHPTTDEGVVEMTVCFRSSYCFYKNIKSCTCKSKKIIYVRNCLRHFIYWLSPTGHQERYCTGNIKLDGPEATETMSFAIECLQYKELEDRSRVWDTIHDVKTDAEEGWYRFQKNSGEELSSQCSASKDRVTRMAQPCGAAFRGWMIDKHPSFAEGRVKRRICFSSATECHCEFFTNINVRNCGTYFVYRLRRPPLPSARYCGASNGQKHVVNDAKKPPIGKPKNICEMYKILHDPDRLWSYTSPTVKKCDAHFYGRYRFGSKYTPWNVKEGCNKTDMSVITHRCGSTYQGYMEDRHPTVSEGYVERIICFQDASSPCECSFTSIIGVQNCSGFYVYNMFAVPKCHARYCMVANKTTNIKIDPGRPPLYDIPTPGYRHVVALKQKKDYKENKSLIVTTTVLSIILLIVLVILIAIVLLLLFCIWPLYKGRKQPKKQRDDIPIVNLDHPDSKTCGSNGSLPRDQITNDNYRNIPTNNNEDFVDITIPPRPSRAPPIDQPPIFSPDLPPMPSDDDETEKKSPISDTSFPELPEEVKEGDDEEEEDVEESGGEEEYDTLMKKEDCEPSVSFAVLKDNSSKKQSDPCKSYDSAV